MKPKPEPAASKAPDRREFVKACCAIAAGGAASAVPIAAGLNFLSDPVRRQTDSSSGFVLVAALSALPDNGQPKQFPVIADRTDAWNRFPQVRLGAVYLRRTGPLTVEALNVICPHLGCAVDFQRARSAYLCPCHNSSFRLDGSIADKNSPSRRPLDSLEVEVRAGGEVWVKFMNFQTFKAEKIPLA